MLCDFGLAKEKVAGDSQAKSFCGSPAYLAPEMLKRTGHGKSVDWYLLGVLLYEMLVGIPTYSELILYPTPTSPPNEVNLSPRQNDNQQLDLYFTIY